MTAADKEAFDGIYAENEQLREEIVRLTAERDEARALVQTLGNQAERFRRERDQAQREYTKLKTHPSTF